MCLTLMMGSQRELPELPWDNFNRKFHVKKFESKDVLPTKAISAKYYYHLGSHEGCGCGFSLEGSAETDEDYQARIANYKELHSYLTANGVEDNVEMFYCWMGDEAESPERVELLKLSDLKKVSVGFEEKVMYRLVKE